MSDTPPAAPPPPGEAGLPPEGITPTVPSPPDAAPGDPYRPLSLLALVGLALAILAAGMVLLGGLAPAAVTWTGFFYASLALLPLGVVAVGAARGRTEPLWLLRYVALGLGAWAVLVGLGGLVVLTGGSPWLLPAWFWAVLAAAALASWAAGNQVQASEGTLSGEEPARLGLGIALCTAAIYGAYYAGSIWAIQTQARAQADEFLRLIRAGEVLQAFLLTIPPGSRPPTGSDPLTAVEIEHNKPRGPGEGGAYTALSESELVRLLEMAGDQAVIEPRGVSTDLAGPSFYVTFEHRVKTPWFTYGMTVTVEGKITEGQRGGRARAWAVTMGATGILPDKRPQPTEAGRTMSAALEAAHTQLSRFLAAYTEDRLDDAFLMTRPPAERKGKGKAQTLKSPAREAFVQGELVTVKNAWYPQPLRGDVSGLARKLFNPDVPRQLPGTPPMPLLDLSLPPRAMPRYAEKDGTATFTFPIRLTGADPVKKGPGGRPMPRFVGDGEVTVQGPLASPAPDEFRITEVRVIRIKPPPEGPTPPPPPPGPPS